MVSQPFSIPALIDPNRYRGKKIAPETLRHAGEKDLFVDALLELPTAHQRRRNPLDWAVSLIVHVTLIAALLAVPLYFNETLDLKAYCADHAGGRASATASSSSLGHGQTDRAAEDGRFGLSRIGVANVHSAADCDDQGRCAAADTRRWRDGRRTRWSSGRYSGRRDWRGARRRARLGWFRNDGATPAEGGEEDRARWWKREAAALDQQPCSGISAIGKGREDFGHGDYRRGDR